MNENMWKEHKTNMARMRAEMGWGKEDIRKKYGIVPEAEKTRCGFCGYLLKNEPAAKQMFCDQRCEKRYEMKLKTAESYGMTYMQRWDSKNWTMKELEAIKQQKLL